MEKTVREFARELDISKEAIYRKINHSMKKQLADHVVKKNNSTYISDAGQSIIIQSLSFKYDDVQNILQNQETTTNDANILDTDSINMVNNIDNVEYIRFLEKQVNLLQRLLENEINSNRREREELNKINQELIRTFNTEQHLYLTDKQLQLKDWQSMQLELSSELSETPPQKINIFKRIFRKNKRKEEK